MTPFLIDSHCHLHFPAYQTDLDAVLLRMQEKRIWGITVGTSAKTSEEGIRFSEKHETIFASVGYHPEYLTSAYRDPLEGEVEDFSIEEIERFARSSERVVAIGETGLDFFRIDEGRDREEAKKIQEDAFRAQLRLASKLKKPLIIHCRDALTRLAEVVKEEQDAGFHVEGVVHCFTGTWSEAQPLLALGLHLSFTGIVTFPPKKNSDPEQHVQRVIERMSLERLLVETDAPWLTPIPHRGEKNEPSYVEFVAQKVAELRGISLGEVAAKTTENAVKLFKIS